MKLMHLATVRISAAALKSIKTLKKRALDRLDHASLSHFLLESHVSLADRLSFDGAEFRP